MKAPEKQTRLHKPKIENANGVLVRQCTVCGATWKLGPAQAGHQTLAWRPIAELDFDGNPVDGVVIDILYCPVEAEQPKQQTQNLAPKPSNVGMCACRECNGRKRHWEGHDTCACKRCEGRRAHNWL